MKLRLVLSTLAILPVLSAPLIAEPNGTVGPSVKKKPAETLLASPVKPMPSKMKPSVSGALSSGQAALPPGPDPLKTADL